jgi:two-component system, cell cycle sensor histidine kinase and response regulator CckA
VTRPEVSDIGSALRQDGLLARLNLSMFRSTVDGVLLSANESFLTVLGYATIEEAIAAYPLLPLFQKIAFAAVDAAEANPVESKLRNSGGAEIWVSAWVALSPDEAGVVEGFFADVTRNKRMQLLQMEEDASARQMEKLESLGRLSGGVAHDFNNLLTTITGYSELLLLSLGANSPVRQDVLEIRSAGMRAARLTRELLAFGRRQVFQNRIVDLNSVVLAVDPAAWCNSMGIEFKFKLEDPLRPILADPVHIETIISNLVCNARDALPSGGEVNVMTGNVDIGEERALQELQEEFPGARESIRPGRYVSLSVSDNGVGMGPEMLTRVFDPFFTTKHQSKSAGLGLSTVYGIVKQSEGHILVESAPGKGATFRVLLPAAPGGSDRS